MGELRFDGRVAVVTGAGGGLGEAYALLLAARGARVVVNDIGGSLAGEGSDAGPAEAVARRIREAGGEAVADTHSVATAEGGRALVRAALDAYGRLDILINNAGILRDAEFARMTPEHLASVLDVHLKGAFHVTQPAWTAMRDQRYGRVVMTTSAAGILGTAGKSNYAAAKTGLIGLTRVLAIEGADHHIKVNALAPIAATRMLAGSMPAADRADDPRLAVMKTLVARLDPALVAPAVAFLAHEDCPATGEIFTAGAGQVARFFVGRTPGYYDPALSIEDVRDHFAEIRDEKGHTVPAGPGDEITELFRTITSTR